MEFCAPTRQGGKEDCFVNGRLRDKKGGPDVLQSRIKSPRNGYLEWTRSD
jgi:hypothetical protein